MNSVSECCLKPIDVGVKKWYPMGDQFPVHEKVDYCQGCGKEVEDPVLVHECCGTEICECEGTCGRCDKESAEEICESCMEVMLLGAPEHRFEPDANFFKEIGVTRNA